MSNSRLIIEENTPQHLCVTCKYVNKCRRMKEIHNSLSDIESDALENWKINLDVTYQINECDLYVVDMDMVRAIQQAVEMLEDDDLEDLDE